MTTPSGEAKGGNNGGSTTPTNPTSPADPFARESNSFPPKKKN